MTEKEALLRAILEDPADDTVRLVYADWLDEHPEMFECDRCKKMEGAVNWVPGHTPNPYSSPYWQVCSKCEGTTRIPDDSHDRAEYIRLQIQNDKDIPADILKAVRQHGLEAAAKDKLKLSRRLRVKKYQNLKREEELWTTYYWDWIGESLILTAHNNRAFWSGRNRPIIFRRGFVDEIVLPTNLFTGAPCANCLAGGLDLGFWHGTTCAWCAGSGLSPGFAKELFSSHPITKVTLRGRAPVDRTAVNDHWYWFKEEGPEHEPLADHIDHRLFEIMAGGRKNVIGLPYLTKELAHAALSYACVYYGRELAGLGKVT